MIYKRQFSLPTGEQSIVITRHLNVILPQKESLQVLPEFLHFNVYRKLEDIPIDALRKLARSVLTLKMHLSMVISSTDKQ